jgi:hypothetical protein
MSGETLAVLQRVLSSYDPHARGDRRRAAMEAIADADADDDESLSAYDLLHAHAAWGARSRRGRRPTPRSTGS